MANWRRYVLRALISACLACRGVHAYDFTALTALADGALVGETVMRPNSPQVFALRRRR